MTRLTGRLITLLSCGIVLLGMATGASTVAKSPANLSRIDEKIWLYQPEAPGSNSLIVERGDGLLVVGAQHSPDAARKMLKEIGTVSSSPVSYLVLPHAQAVTAGGASAFPESTLVIASGHARTDLENEDYDFGGELRLVGAGR